MKRAPILWAALCLTLPAVLTAPAPLTAKEEKVDAPEEAAAAASDPRVYAHYLGALLLERRGDFDRALKEYNRTLKLEPGATTIYRQRANLYLKMGNAAKALDDAQSYVRANPKDTEALILLANIHNTLGQKNAAVLVLEKVLESEPAHEEALLNIANLQMNDEPGKALRVLEKLIKINPGATEAYYSLGLAHQRLGNVETSRKMFEKVIQLDGDSVPSLVLLGQMKETAGKMDEAAVYYERALDQMPENLALRIQLVLLHAQKSNFAKIEKLLELFKDDAAAPLEAKLWLGIIHENRKEWAKALQYYQQAYEENKSGELLIRIASIHSHLSDGKSAAATLRLLVKSNPDNAQFHYFLGLAYMDLKEFSKAAKTFKKSIAVKSDSSQAYFQLGVALDSMKKWKDAEPNFKEAIRLDRNNASANNYLGYSLVDRNIRLDEARKYIERALEIDQDNPAYLDSLGWLNFHEGRIDDALRQLKLASQKMNDPVILEHLADCYVAAKDDASAALNYQKSLELDSDNESVQKKLKRLYGKMLPGSPARVLLEQFLRDMGKASYISGALLLRSEGPFVPASTANQARGFFYVRKLEPLKSSTVVPTDLRVDLLNPYSLPSAVLRYHYGKTTSWSVFPPEFERDLPEETRWILQTVASFLNGDCLRPFKNNEALVSDKSKGYSVTMDSSRLSLDAQGRVTELVTPEFAIEIGQYQQVQDIRLPQKMRIRYSSGKDKKRASRTLSLEFPNLSLEKIENKIFEIGKEK